MMSLKCTSEAQIPPWTPDLYTELPFVYTSQLTTSNERLELNITKFELLD